MKQTALNLKMVEQFLDQEISNFPEWFRSYDWRGDSWEKGFPDLFELEKEISKAARQNSIGKKHLLDVADWGGLRNKKRISCPKIIKIQLYQNELPVNRLRKEPARIISELEDQITGFGPTYLSKILHFAVPEVFGALDTRLVRTFGVGDTSIQKYHFLDLKVTKQKSGWAIPRQRLWPDDYGRWINTLNYIAEVLNERGPSCPHPKQYITERLRQKGKWLPADIETALFSYASKRVLNLKK